MCVWLGRGGMAMSKLRIRHGDWVVVCDGKKALVLENAGDEKFLNFKTREVLDHPDPKTHELGTDAPGRTFSSVGSGAQRRGADRLAHARRGSLPAQAARSSRRRPERRPSQVAD